MASEEPEAAEYDVTVVGGGPAGCSAAIFTARYGLDTLVFDRGRSSIQRCAHLANYLGFPAGIGVGTFYDLMHDQVEEAGGEVIADLVESVRRDELADGGEGVDEGERDVRFVVETQDGRRVRTRRVVAATRYDGEYLRELCGDDLFVTHERGDDAHEHVDRSYPEADGTTPIPGLYVASPSEAADRQAIVAAGRGAEVGLQVVEDVRRERGFPDSIATHYDWIRREAELTDEWVGRDRWREWFDDHLPGETDAESATDEDRPRELREREIDRRFDTYLPAEEVERRNERGQERLLAHVDDDVVLRAADEIRRERQSTEAGD